MAELIQEFNTAIEGLAASTALKSNDSYFVNDLFLSIVRQNPSIEAVARIDPSGIVINRVTQKGLSGVSKKVADERWFGIVTGNGKPYSDLWSEPSGRIFLLRAWPLIDSSADSSRLAGLFTVKIDVRKFLSSLASAETNPVLIAYKGETVASSNWREGEPFGQKTMTLPGGDHFTLRFQGPADPEPVSENHAVKQSPAGGSLRHSAALSARPQLPSTAVTDSLLIGSNFPALNSGRISLITILAILTLIAIAISLFIVLRMMFRKNDAPANTSDLSPGPIDAYMIPEPSLEAPLRDTKEVWSPLEAEFITDGAVAERETRELPALKERIAESSQKLRCMDLSGDPADRDRLLREIHENLSLWVCGELQHLTNHLSSLSQSIKECERRDGPSAELQVLRYDVERIMEEIQAVERKVPGEIFS
jgi:hypothetical protein